MPAKAKPPTPIEHKTSWATYAAGIYSAAVAYFVANPGALDWAPAWAKSLVAFIVGTGIVRGAAYWAPPTDRSAPAGTSNATYVYSQTAHGEPIVAADPDKYGLPTETS